MIQTLEQQTPNKVLNAFGGWLGSARTPEETLALSNIINRKIATYGSASFYEVFKDTAKEITKLKVGLSTVQLVERSGINGKISCLGWTTFPIQTQVRKVLQKPFKHLES